MKKKFLTAIILLCTAISCALCLSACGGKTDPGGEPTPPPLEKAPAPIELTLSQGEDYIGIAAVNYADGYRDTECKLDDGAWQALSVDWDEHSNHITFTDLEPGSTHTVYVRAAASDTLDASDSISKSATLNKAEQTEKPEGLSVKMTTGRTAEVVGLTEEMEVCYNYTYNSETNEWVNTGTHTYDKTGVVDIFVRYKESASHLAGSPVSLRAYATDFGGGMGSEQDPFRIENYEQLAAISDTDFLYLVGNKAYFRLENDIDFTGKAHTPINALRVCLDGNGKKFTGVNTQKTFTESFDNMGTFDRITEVRNLTIENATVSIVIDGIADVYAGIIAGTADIIENCTVGGTINVSIKNGDNFGDKTISNGITIGGLTSSANKINNCSADVKVVLPDAVMRNYDYDIVIGGLCGRVQNKVSNSSAKLAVSGGNNAAVSNGAGIGGLIYGIGNDGQIENCFAEVNANISLEAPNATATKNEGLFGGLIGSGLSPVAAVKNSYALFNFSVKADEQREVIFGGITAGGVKSAENCFADGTFTAEGQFELNGANYLSKDAFAGKTNYSNSGTETPSVITNCYYASDSGITSETAAAAVTRSEMRTVEWQKAHLNFDENVWTFNDGTDSKFYPTLK